MGTMSTRLGILSDTHGLLRPSALERLRGCDLLVHAGDVGDEAVLPPLDALAPLHVVRGNVDVDGTLGRLPATVELTLDGVEIRVVHRREDVPASWLRLRPGLVVFGHSHRPELEWRGDLLMLNPGAAGRPRFRLPTTLAIVTLHQGRITPEIIALDD